MLKVEDMEKRRQSDLEWSKKFIQMDWPNLMKEWNQQEVFASEGTHPKREEGDYSRKALAQALQNWSVTEHPFSLADLTQLTVPSLWVAGANDHKFVAILNNLKAKNLPAEFLILDDCGHRIGLSKNPELIAAIINLC